MRLNRPMRILNFSMFGVFVLAGCAGQRGDMTSNGTLGPFPDPYVPVDLEFALVRWTEMEPPGIQLPHSATGRVWPETPAAEELSRFFTNEQPIVRRQEPKLLRPPYHYLVGFIPGPFTLIDDFRAADIRCDGTRLVFRVNFTQGISHDLEPAKAAAFFILPLGGRKAAVESVRIEFENYWIDRVQERSGRLTAPLAKPLEIRVSPIPKPGFAAAAAERIGGK